VPFLEDSLIESLLLAVTRVTTLQNKVEKTNATGFFFERDGHPNAAGHAVAARSLEPAIRAALGTVTGAQHATRP